MRFSINSLKFLTRMCSPLLGILFILDVGLMPLFGNISVYLYYAIFTACLMNLILSWPDIKNTIFKFSPLLLAMLAFAIWAGLSLIWTIQFSYSYHEWLETIAFIITAHIIISAPIPLHTSLIKRAIYPAIIIAAVIFCADRLSDYALTNYLHANARGFYPKQPLELLTLLSLFIFMQDWQQKIFIKGMAALILILAVATSESDTTKLTLIVAGLYAIYTALISKRMNYFSLIVTFVTLSIASPFIVDIVHFVTEKTHSVELLKPSWVDRLRIWSDYEHILFQKFIFGWGLKSSWLMGDKIGYEGYPHNAFFQLWIELGLIGTLITNAIFISVTTWFYKNKNVENFRNYSIIAIAIIIPLLTGIKISAFWYWYAIIVGFFVILNNDTQAIASQIDKPAKQPTM